MARSAEFHKAFDVVKMDDELGLVFGFGIVTAQGGEPYYDTQGDHIPDDAMLKAATEFALSERVSTDLHVRDDQGAPVQDGTAVFLFPLTAEVAKALEIETPRTGLLVAIKPSPAVYEKFRSGEYRGFSIGGKRLQDEVVEP